MSGVSCQVLVVSCQLSVVSDALTCIEFRLRSTAAQPNPCRSVETLFLYFPLWVEFFICFYLLKTRERVLKTRERV
ncbi:hypothetical protein, partial [Atlanticothrix silvestris]|uniref:hypothetical protein n=1 Tax=Atlanticothrix silvestris TaxID=2840444 RepID=UPI001BDC97D9